MVANIFRRDSPKLDRTNYGTWKVRMEIHLNCIGRDVWDITKNGYTTPTQNQPNPPTLAKDLENDSKAREALLSTLLDQQVMGLSNQSTTKASWDKMETLYEGDATIKIAKLECYQVRYEN